MSDPQKMNTRDIIVHLSTNILAGSDTTAIALKAIIYFLIRSLDKVKKFVAQIDEADQSGKLSNPIRYKEAITHLPYLDAVIQEAMRPYPSVGLLFERHVPPSGAQICGQHIPGGTIVDINAWVLQHDQVVYPEPEKFIPERWLESSEEQLKQME
jgi:cytochrome P450